MQWSQQLYSGGNGSGALSFSATTTVMSSMSALDAFLDRDKRENANESWNRLNKTMRLRKLTEYAKTYCAENALADEERTQLVAFFRDCLDRKKLHRIKEVQYDVETGRVVNVPVLAYNHTARRYTLKNTAATASTASTTARVRGGSGGGSSSSSSKTTAAAGSSTGTSGRRKKKTAADNEPVLEVVEAVEADIAEDVADSTAASAAVDVSDST